jgi:hypothetical protein
MSSGNTDNNNDGDDNDDARPFDDDDDDDTTFGFRPGEADASIRCDVDDDLHSANVLSVLLVFCDIDAASSLAFLLSPSSIVFFVPLLAPLVVVVVDDFLVGVVGSFMGLINNAAPPLRVAWPCDGRFDVSDALLLVTDASECECDADADDVVEDDDAFAAAAASLLLLDGCCSGSSSFPVNLLFGGRPRFLFTKC